MNSTLLNAMRNSLRLVQRWAVFGLRALGWSLLGLAWGWSCLAIGLFRPLPGAVAISLALLWVCGTVALFLGLPRRQAVAGVIAGVALIWAVWSLQPARNDRDWTLDQARLPRVVIVGERVVVENVRNAVYRSEDDYDVAWERRSFDLGQIESLDFVMSPFSSSGALAHVFVTFAFRDGEHLAISVEIRKAQGETYSPLYGMFHRYELMYVIGDESDLIGLRANIRQHPVYLYPVKATRAQVRQLFVSMLARAERLRTTPEFYHTLANACGSNLLWHVNEVRQAPIRWDWRVLLPGFSDELAFDLGLIDFDGPLTEARERFSIEGRTLPWTTGKAWSQQIRATGVNSGVSDRGQAPLGPG